MIAMGTNNNNEYTTSDYVEKSIADAMSTKEMAKKMEAVLKEERCFDEPFIKAICFAVNNSKELRNYITNAVLWGLAARITGLILASATLIGLAIDLALRYFK